MWGRPHSTNRASSKELKRVSCLWSRKRSCGSNVEQHKSRPPASQSQFLVVSRLVLGGAGNGNLRWVVRNDANTNTVTQHDQALSRSNAVPARRVDLSVRTSARSGCVAFQRPVPARCVDLSVRTSARSGCVAFQRAVPARWVDLSVRTSARSGCVAFQRPLSLTGTTEKPR